MKPNERFIGLPPRFWALVRLVGQECGYAHGGEIGVPDRNKVSGVLTAMGLSSSVLDCVLRDEQSVWAFLHAYLSCRRDMLHRQVEPNLMDASQAKKEYMRLKRELKPRCPLPMNKQSGLKKAPAFLTGMVNMLIEANAAGNVCDYDPRSLTTVSSDNALLRTFARRLDGAFPSVLNPVAVWEIKEYYYTTTFGSRVADGVYETLLDGMEIKELADSEKIDIRHYLMIDARYTWWDCGKSYLCRLIDMLHMGYVDEVLVGREVLSRLPDLVKEWVKIGLT